MDTQNNSSKEIVFLDNMQQTNPEMMQQHMDKVAEYFECPFEKKDIGKQYD